MGTIVTSVLLHTQRICQFASSGTIRSIIVVTYRYQEISNTIDFFRPGDPAVDTTEKSVNLHFQCVIFTGKGSKEKMRACIFPEWRDPLVPCQRYPSFPRGLHDGEILDCSLRSKWHLRIDTATPSLPVIISLSPSYPACQTGIEGNRGSPSGVLRPLSWNLLPFAGPFS